jgi:hypothetical protein
LVFEVLLGNYVLSQAQDRNEDTLVSGLQQPIRKLNATRKINAPHSLLGAPQQPRPKISIKQFGSKRYLAWSQHNWIFHPARRRKHRS